MPPRHLAWLFFENRAYPSPLPKKVPIRTSGNWEGSPFRFSLPPLVGAKSSAMYGGGGSPPPICQHARCCGSRMRSAFEISESTHRGARTGGAGGRSAQRRLVLAIRNNSARHARKSKAVSPLVAGFIFPIDSSRLFAPRVANS